jgi:hypothetical protein
MARPPKPDAAAEPGTEAPGPTPLEPSVASSRAASAALGNLSDLPVAGLTRRRVAILLGGLIVAWVLVLFARQVGEASQATALAAEMRVQNARLEAQSGALGAELALIQRSTYIGQVARQYRLGSADEIPFVLADDAPRLAADAPGSAEVRLGSDPARPTPLESWARLLFGDEGEDAAEPAPTGSPLGN